MDDYIEANYNLKGVVSGEISVFNADVFDKSNVIKYYRDKLARFDKNVQF
jgi:hypothetical protein|tara:strand:+ start:744 stop:893 length:150 start_codon:yes stop_codon:yes gene_type:complete